MFAQLQHTSVLASLLISCLIPHPTSIVYEVTHTVLSLHWAKHSGFLFFLFFFPFSSSSCFSSCRVETLVPTDTISAQGDWREDWDNVVLQAIDEEQPSYLFYRLDNKNESGERHILRGRPIFRQVPQVDRLVASAVAPRPSSGYTFVFIAWSPDYAHIKQKMMYASTRATCKQIFGSVHIAHELFGTLPVWRRAVGGMHRVIWLSCFHGGILIPVPRLLGRHFAFGLRQVCGERVCAATLDHGRAGEEGNSQSRGELGAS